MVFLPALVQRLDEMGATVRIETAQLTADEIAVQLESGELDFAAGYLASMPRSVAEARLFREHYVCMMRRSHPLARDGHLSLKEFLAASHVFIESMGSGHKNIERTLSAQGLKREVSLRVPHFVVVPMIVASTDRIVTAPSRVANVFSTLVKVRVCPVPREVPVVRRLAVLAYAVRFRPRHPLDARRDDRPVPGGP